jgi:hypothetical protein
MSSQHVPFDENICINPAAVKKAQDQALKDNVVLEQP